VKFIESAHRRSRSLVEFQAGQQPLSEEDSMYINGVAKPVGTQRIAQRPSRTTPSPTSIYRFSESRTPEQHLQNEVAHYFDTNDAIAVAAGRIATLGEESGRKPGEFSCLVSPPNFHSPKHTRSRKFGSAQKL